MTTTYQAVGEETIQSSQEYVENGSGYIPLSTQAETQYGEEQRVAEENSALQGSEDLDAIQARLGVTLGDLSQQDAPVQTQTDQQKLEALQAQQAQQEYLKKFNTQEGQRFRKEFKEYLGVDPLEAFQQINVTNQVVQELAAWRAQTQNEKAIGELQAEWGEDFEGTWAEVRDRFTKLPPQMQKALDNLDGARLIAAQIRQESQGKQRDIPQYQRGSTVNKTTSNLGSPKNVVRTSDFYADKVTEQEYLLALKQGRVIKDA